MSEVSDQRSPTVLMACVYCFTLCISFNHKEKSEWLLSYFSNQYWDLILHLELRPFTQDNCQLCSICGALMDPWDKCVVYLFR